MVFPAASRSPPAVRSDRKYTVPLDLAYGLMVTQHPGLIMVFRMAGDPSSSYLVAHTASMAAPSSE